MYSIVAPIDTNRLEQFTVTKRLYDAMPQVKEFIMPTRSYDKVLEYLTANDLMKDVKLIPYTHELGFNPSKALNIGVRNAKYDQIIITSPEVKPVNNVLEQLQGFIGKNVVCQVSDTNADGQETQILVSKIFRADNPGMYFLAMFNKSDIEKINGWDEDFMKGYAYEDNDFGARWVRAGLPFEINEEIKGIHQYHPRSETIPNGAAVNNQKFMDNTDNNITYCKNGLNTI
jgi:GT2 family glycosyltransferase